VKITNFTTKSFGTPHIRRTCLILFANCFSSLIIKLLYCNNSQHCNYQRCGERGRGELSSRRYSDDDGLIAEAFDYIFYVYNINNIMIFRLKEEEKCLFLFMLQRRTRQLSLFNYEL